MAVTVNLHLDHAEGEVARFVGIGDVAWLALSDGHGGEVCVFLTKEQAHRLIVAAAARAAYEPPTLPQTIELPLLDYDAPDGAGEEVEASRG